MLIHITVKCTVLFDGYCENALTEDQEHKKRLLKAKVTPNMSVELENRFTDVTQKSFLNSSKNKQKFINLLSDELTGDADTVIASKTLDYACAGNSLKLIRADSDLLIMLLYFWNSEMAEITMLSEPTKKNKGIVHSISRITESISDIRKYVTCAIVLVDVTQHQHFIDLIRYAYQDC